MRALIGGWASTEREAVAELRSLIADVFPTLTADQVAAVTQQMRGRYVVEECGSGARGWAVLHVHPGFFLSDVSTCVSDVLGGDERA